MMLYKIWESQCQTRMKTSSSSQCWTYKILISFFFFFQGLVSCIMQSIRFQELMAALGPHTVKNIFFQNKVQFVLVFPVFLGISRTKPYSSPPLKNTKNKSENLDWVVSVGNYQICSTGWGSASTETWSAWCKQWWLLLSQSAFFSPSIYFFSKTRKPQHWMQYYAG